MTQIKLQHIEKTFAAERTAFQCEQLLISAGSKVGIAGETGSGKSTLLKIIAGLEKPDLGETLFNSEPIYPKLDRLIPGHPEMAYLSQSFELPKFVTVYEFLDDRLNDETDILRITEICRISHLIEKDTGALSGGERQRVALAKILLKRPKVLLLDEPYSNLDPHHKRDMKEVIEEIGSETGATILMVSHEPTDLLPWADEILVLKGSKIVQKAEPNQIYLNPEDVYVAGLFGEYQIIDEKKWKIGDGNRILRPEQFTIGKKGKEGIVKSIRYQGSHDLLFVKIDDDLIKVRSKSGDLKVGESIGLSLETSVYQETASSLHP